MELEEEAWTVWSDAKQPVFEGTENAAKTFAENARPNHDLYIQNSRGEEYVYEGGTWVEV